MELEDLKSVGALSADLQKIHSNYSKIVSLSIILARGQPERIQKGEIVTVDKPVWFATQKGRPLKEAKSVYSCSEDGMIGCWKKTTREFLLMQLSGNTLQTNKQIKFKEETNMAKQVNLESDLLEESMEKPIDGGNKELQDLNFVGEDLNEDISKYQQPKQQEEQPIDQDAAGNTKSSEEIAKDKKEAAKQERARKKLEAKQSISEIKKKIAGVTLADRSNVQAYNQKYGRFMFFVTATDDTIKISRKKVPVTNSNGDRQWDLTNKDVNQEEQAKHKDLKKIPIKFCVCQNTVAFKNAKPGKIVGMCLAIPAGNVVSIDQLASGEKLTVNDTKDLEYILYTKETGMAAIAASFGKTIRESSNVMGAQAGVLMLETKEVQKKNSNKDKEKNAISYGVQEKEIRTSIKLQPQSCPRKASNMVNNLNYIPLKSYVTIPYDQISEENRQFADNNIAALFKKADVKLSDFKDEDQARISRDDKGVIKTKWFTKESSLPDILAFDANSKSDKPIASINIPKRIEGTTNDGSKKFDYQYRLLGSEDGPQTDSRFVRLIELAHFSVDEFVKQAMALQTMNTAGNRRSSEDTQLDVDEVLKNLISGKVTSNFGNKDVISAAYDRSTSLSASGKIEQEMAATEEFEEARKRQMEDLRKRKEEEAAARKAEKAEKEKAAKETETGAETETEGQQ